MNKKADSKEFIFQRLKDEREKLAFFGVKNIGLFGSFVRGSQTSLSDIDILVEFMPEKHTFDNFMEVAFLRAELQALLDATETRQPDSRADVEGERDLTSSELGTQHES
jgi:hypothetical protein